MEPRISDEVAEALAGGRAVVALESTLLAHGLPPGRNRAVAAELESVVREHGAVPATVAVLDGQPRIGLDATALDRVCDPDAGLVKLSARDLAPAVALGRSGATTVAGTAVLAARAGIEVFATGGLGGVHRQAERTWDVSADLATLATTPVLVVCSGVKSILDVAATAELLETLSVPVLGYRTDELAGFYLRASGVPVPWRVEEPAEAAAVLRHHERGGVVLANPVPAEHEMDRAAHDALLAAALDGLQAGDPSGGAGAGGVRGVAGKDVTPALLEHFHAASEGASVAANVALVLSNAALAARVAIALGELTPR